jgi:DNA invertase Pin-like site-specific DNA recombinase
VAKAYSYLRFSTPEQQRGDSFRRQTQLAVAYADQHGLELDDALTFHDLGVSAYRGKNAETGRLGDFLAAVDDGLVPAGSILLVESLDRISRQSARKALRVLEDIVERDVAVATLSDGRRYTKEALDSDPMSLLLAILTFIRSNEESSMKAARLQAAWAAKRAKAAEKPLTGICPAWLRLDGDQFVLIEDRAAIVQRMFADAAAGRGKHAIAAGLNRDGVPTFGHRGRRGKLWHSTYVAKLLDSPTVIGTMTPHRMDHSKGKPRRVPQFPVVGYYPAAVDPALWDRVQALRRGSQQPLRGRHANAGVVRNVFGGLARCPRCEGTMTRVTKGGRWVYLVCAAAKAGAGCEYHAVPYAKVEGGLLNGIDKIEYECPTGNPETDAAVLKSEALDDEVWHLQDEIENLVGYAGRARSPAIAERVVELEGLIEETRQRQRELARGLGFAMPDRLSNRLRELREAVVALREAGGAAATDTDGSLRGSLNAALRALFRSVVVDYTGDGGHLALDFLHGGTAYVTYDYGFPPEPGGYHFE